MTVKDQYHVNGMRTTMGYVGWIDTFEGSATTPCRRAAESEIIRELEALGAVIIGKVWLSCSALIILITGFGLADITQDNSDSDSRRKLVYKSCNQQYSLTVMKFMETNNNILGYNFNPRNQKLSSGGSSGGA